MADQGVSAVPTQAPSDLDIMTSLNLAFDLSAVAMLLVDDSLRVIKANPAAHQMLAVDPLTGRSVTAFSIPDIPGRSEQKIQSWLTGELTHLDRETDLVSGTGETLRTVI